MRQRAIRDGVRQMLELEASRTRDSTGRLLTKVSRQKVTEEPGARWNAFVALLATAGYEELAASQRPAWLVFQYDAEVQNGGHTLYFDVHGGQHVEKTAQALRELGAAQHATVLLEAASRWEAAGDEAEFGDLDQAFHSAEPDLRTAFEQLLAAQPHEFLLVE